MLPCRFGPSLPFGEPHMFIAEVPFQPPDNGVFRLSLHGVGDLDSGGVLRFPVSPHDARHPNQEWRIVHGLSSPHDAAPIGMTTPASTDGMAQNLAQSRIR